MNTDKLTKYKTKLNILGINIVEHNNWAIKTYRSISNREYYGYIDTTDRSGIDENYSKVDILDYFIVAQDEIFTYTIKTEGKPKLINEGLMAIRPLDYENYKEYEVILLLDAIKNSIILINKHGKIVEFNINKDKYLTTLSIDLTYSAKQNQYITHIDEILPDEKNTIEHITIKTSTDFNNIEIKNDTYRNITQEL